MNIKKKEATLKKKKIKGTKEKPSITQLWKEWKKGKITSKEIVKKIPKKIKKKIAKSMKKKSKEKLSTDELIKKAIEDKPELVFEQLRKIDNYEVIQETEQTKNRELRERQLKVNKKEKPRQEITFTTSTAKKAKKDEKKDEKDDGDKKKSGGALKQPPGSPSSLLDNPKLVKALIVIIVILFIVSLAATL